MESHILTIKEFQIDSTSRGEEYYSKCEKYKYIEGDCIISKKTYEYDEHGRVVLFVYYNKNYPEWSESTRTEYSNNIPFPEECCRISDDLGCYFDD